MFDDMSEHRENLETGDRVFNDVTVAIRLKHGLARVHGPGMLTKCPECHKNYKDKEQHLAEECPGVIQRPAKRQRAISLFAKHGLPKRPMTRCGICNCPVAKSKLAQHIQRVHSKIRKAPKKRKGPKPVVSRPTVSKDGVRTWHPT